MRALADPGYRITCTASGGYTVQIGPDFAASGIDFGVAAIGNKLTGVAFDDRNNNGIQDANERPLAGWRVVAIANDRTSNNPFPRVEMDTDATGHYSLTLTPGASYSVGIIQASIGSAVPTVLHVMTLSRNATLNFGENVGSISGMVFNDLNKNGRQDAGEPALSGWLMNYCKTSGATTSYSNPVASDTTGHFLIADLPTGNYRLMIALAPLLNPYTLSKPVAGQYAFTLRPGQNLTGYDFGRISQQSPAGVTRAARRGRISARSTAQG